MQHKRGAKPIIHNNRLVKSYLLPCKNLKTACGVFSFADNIFTGVALLHYSGNTRPLDKTVLFDIVRNLENISTEAIQIRTKYSLRHSVRLASACRVLSKAFESNLINYTMPDTDNLDGEIMDYSSFVAADQEAYRQFLIKRYTVA